MEAVAFKSRRPDTGKLQALQQLSLWGFFFVRQAKSLTPKEEG